MPVTSQDPDPLTSRVYNSVWQLRADAWVSLAEVTRRLIADPPDLSPNEPGAGLPEPVGAGPGAELLERTEELDRNCHKSHHYGLVLAGAHVVYLNAYPLDQYGMYGAVPVAELKRTLLAR
jgi:Orn/Lys/Arg decarboxylase, major domain